MGESLRNTFWETNFGMNFKIKDFKSNDVEIN